MECMDIFRCPYQVSTLAVKKMKDDKHKTTILKAQDPGPHPPPRIHTPIEDHSSPDGQPRSPIFLLFILPTPLCKTNYLEGTPQFDQFLPADLSLSEEGR